MKHSWGQELSNAVRTGKFSKPAKKAVESWNTCAVGETPVGIQNVVTDFEYNGPRRGTQLNRLGMSFMRAVVKDRVSRAVYLYGAIKDHLLSRVA